MPQAIACSFVTTPVPCSRLRTIRLFVTSVSTSSRNFGIDSRSRPAARDEVVRDVDRETADAHVRDGQSGAAAGLDQAVDVLPVLVEVHEVRQRADVHEVRADADAVVHDPGELRQDRAHELPRSGTSTPSIFSTVRT